MIYVFCLVLRITAGLRAAMPAAVLSRAAFAANGGRGRPIALLADASAIIAILLAAWVV